MKNFIYTHLKIASLILATASFAVMAMDSSYWERDNIRELARSYRSLEQQNRLAGEISLLRGLHDRLGQNSPVNITSTHIMQEIFTFLAPAPEEYIYLDVYQPTHYFQAGSTAQMSVKVLREGIGTFGELKAHIRQLLHLAPNDHIQIQYGRYIGTDDTRSITFLNNSGFQYGSPWQPFHLILSNLPN